MVQTLNTWVLRTRPPPVNYPGHSLTTLCDRVDGILLSARIMIRTTLHMLGNDDDDAVVNPSLNLLLSSWYSKVFLLLYILIFKISPFPFLPWCHILFCVLNTGWLDFCKCRITVYSIWQVCWFRMVHRQQDITVRHHDRELMIHRGQLEEPWRRGSPESGFHEGGMRLVQ